jgi:hypothetical protein
MALSGGRNAHLRAGMTALGVALGMVVLLFAAAVPNLIRDGDARSAARDTDVTNTGGKAASDTMLIAEADTTFRDDTVRGRLLDPEGDRPPLPPGVDAMPGPGELVVSPALKDLLTSADGRLLRERLGGTIVGTIGDHGLRGPREYVFYEGADDLTARSAERVRGFGREVYREALPGILVFIVAIGVVVLLLPVGVFIATAVRFGSDERDRRLAALRLIGADRAMAVRIAAGEALFGALTGIVLGAILFLALRPLVELFRIQDISVYASDVRPNPALVALIVIAVPVAAIVASVLALRRVVVEPLGVVRRGMDERRRLWWRILPTVAGAAILFAMAGDLANGQQVDTFRVSAGVLLMLIGITALLPWVVDAALSRLRGGSVSWQLATRRLQMDGGTAARVVGGVAVAVAGAIALQTVLSAGERTAAGFTEVDLSRAQMSIQIPGRGLTPDRLTTALGDTPGVVGSTAVEVAYGRQPQRDNIELRVGGCDALREYATLPTCADGDAFVTLGSAAAGSPVKVGRQRYVVPDDARRAVPRVAPNGFSSGGVLLTPGASHGLRTSGIDAYVQIDDAQKDAVDYVRNTAAALSPAALAYTLETRYELQAYRTVRRAIFAAAFVVLALIGASLLVGGLEQLRERRRVLAALSAFGTPRATVVWSVMWQAAIPVALGLAISVSVGVGLGALLLKIASEPLHVDWPAVAGMAGAGAAVILLVTFATLPAVTRSMRPEGLRTE